MSFKFGLQKVLEHRQTLENLAQKDFQDASLELRSREELLKKMEDDTKEARAQAGRVQSESGPSTPASLKQIHEFLVLQKIRIERQKAKVEEQSKLVEELREILRQKAIDLKIMERLKERRRSEYLRELRALEQKETDEINVLRHSFEDGE